HDAESGREQRERTRQIGVETRLAARGRPRHAAIRAIITTSAAPIAVLTALSRSLSSQPRFSATVPSTLSARLPSRPARATSTIAAGPYRPKVAPTRPTRIAPTNPAIVPSALIAPSVPGGTGLKVVIRNVRRPYALPTSEEHVSAAAVATAAA